MKRSRIQPDSNKVKRKPEHLLKVNMDSFVKQNEKIETAFNIISDEIDEQIKSGLFDKAVKLLTFSNIASRAGVSRTSLFASKRKASIDNKMAFLRNIIETEREKFQGIKKTSRRELRELKMSLKKQRNETQVWFLKYQKISIELESKNKLIEEQRSIINKAR